MEFLVFYPSLTETHRGPHDQLPSMHPCSLLRFCKHRSLDKSVYYVVCLTRVDAQARVTPPSAPRTSQRSVSVSLPPSLFLPIQPSRDSQSFKRFPSSTHSLTRGDRERKANPRSREVTETELVVGGGGGGVVARGDNSAVAHLS